MKPSRRQRRIQFATKLRVLQGLVCTLILASSACASDGKTQVPNPDADHGTEAGLQGDGSCTAMGCGSVAVLRTPSLTTSFEEARTYEVRVCRAQTCGKAVLADLDLSLTAPGSGVGLPRLVLPSPEGNDGVSIVVWNVGGALLVEARWEPGLPVYANGDVFLLDVTAPSGASVATVNRAATYETYAPNGPACGPTCLRAVFTEP